MAFRHVRCARPARWLTTTSIRPLAYGGPPPHPTAPARAGQRRTYPVPPAPAPAPPKPKTAPKPPQLTVFHNPCSARSHKLLAELRRAQDHFPHHKFKSGPPLALDIALETRLPTVDELEAVYALLGLASWTAFLAPSTGGDFRTHPTSARSLLAALALLQADARAAPPAPAPAAPPLTADPAHPLFGTDAFLWPLVVCWGARRGSLGSVKAVNGMLRDFAHKRDGTRTAEERKADKEALRVSRFVYPQKEESPPEDETVELFNEQSRGRPRRRRLF